MLFNSYIFIFLFLPLTTVVFYLIGGLGRHQVAMAWLVAASLLFYAWWNPAYIGLILISILFNYALGLVLSRRTKEVSLHYKAIMALGIVANLSLLGYYKYANFFVANVNSLLDTHWQLTPVILPLAISFFTFQQIAYLVDAYRGETKEYNFLHYCLFVTFFPQLIAGPIVHHREMLPQFSLSHIYRFAYDRIAVGTTIFLIGLFKKVVLADNVAVYATPVFIAADGGETLGFFEAWSGALAYTTQIYFDFSGYSDMAIGLGYLLGITLPTNFSSPYKAHNIIDFWRRWHMTLSRFLRDYLYFTLGGGRCGNLRRYSNLLFTMLLGGLWHGAGWTFVVWGALHGSYLVINHAWLALKAKVRLDKHKSIWWSRLLARSLTFFAVVIGWVCFRAESFQGALGVVQGMFGLNGVNLPATAFNHFGWSLRLFLEQIGVRFQYNMVIGQSLEQWSWIATLLVIAWLAPNSQQIMARGILPLGISNRNAYLAENRSLIHWSPTTVWAMTMFVIGVVCILQMSEISEFLYYQF
ncbi:MAG: MBOAT family protein [Gammaproteobacteria bacterium]|nr:MBOAT family protein [Gammaproteobacteria bacterium]